jgi:Ca2+-binding RTX toxin-like protein
MAPGRASLALRTTVAVAGIALTGASFVPDAVARVSCSYAAAPVSALTVTVTGDDTVEIGRYQDEILVNEFLERPKRCRGGSPTVLNTDTINVTLGPGLLASADVYLAGGPLAPGATPESTGASEIEIRATARSGVIKIAGTRGADEYHWGPGGVDAGLNLNPRTSNDQDVDVTVVGRRGSMLVDGGPGNDRIIPAPGWVGPASSIYSAGGAGSDLLSAPQNVGSTLEGEAGKDRLLGGTLADDLYGGTGADYLEGGAGRDRLNGGRGRDLLLGGSGRDAFRSRDRNRDGVRCGPGRDRVRADRRDRVRGCERIRRR